MQRTDTVGTALLTVLTTKNLKTIFFRIHIMYLLLLCTYIVWSVHTHNKRVRAQHSLQCVVLKIVRESTRHYSEMDEKQ